MTLFVGFVFYLLFHYLHSYYSHFTSLSQIFKLLGVRKGKRGLKAMRKLVAQQSLSSSLEFNGIYFIGVLNRYLKAFIRIMVERKLFHLLRFVRFDPFSPNPHFKKFRRKPGA